MVSHIVESINNQFAHPKGVLGIPAAFLMTLSNSFVYDTAVDIADISPTDRVLDIGCGTGKLLKLLSSKLESGSASGIDHSKLMCRIAHLHNRSSIRGGTIALTNESILNFRSKLPFNRIFAVNIPAALWETPLFAEKVRSLIDSEGKFILYHWDTTQGGSGNISFTDLRKLLAGVGFTTERIENYPMEQENNIFAVFRPILR